MSVTDALNLSLTGITIVFIMLSILAIFIAALSVVLRKIYDSIYKPKYHADIGIVKVEEVKEIINVDTVCIHDVPDRTAAMLMAIVADNLGVEPSELYFKSIREIKE